MLISCSFYTARRELLKLVANAAVLPPSSCVHPVSGRVTVRTVCDLYQQPLISPTQIQAHGFHSIPSCPSPLTQRRLLDCTSPCCSVPLVEVDAIVQVLLNSLMGFTVKLWFQMSVTSCPAPSAPPYLFVIQMQTSRETQTPAGSPSSPRSLCKSSTTDKASWYQVPLSLYLAVVHWVLVLNSGSSTWDNQDILMRWI